MDFTAFVSGALVAIGLVVIVIAVCWEPDEQEKVSNWRKKKEDAHTLRLDIDALRHEVNIWRDSALEAGDRLVRLIEYLRLEDITIASIPGRKEFRKKRKSPNLKP